MKRIAIILSLLAAIVSSCRQSGDITAEQTIREFYEQYITHSSKCSDYNPADADRIMKTFLTEGLIRKLELARLDYDPFLNAQDCEMSWIKTLEIRPDTTRENTYEVYYNYDALHRECITLSLVCIDGKYLIDDVNGLSDTAVEEKKYTSAIRPDEQLLPGEILTDRFEYVGYNGDSDYYFFLVKKKDETFWLIDGCPEGTTSALNRGDSVEVRWMIDSIWIAGDDDRLEMTEWAVNIDKTKDGKVSLFRKKLSKPLELYNETDEETGLSESYLFELRDSVEYCMANFMQEEVQEALDDDPSAIFYCNVYEYEPDYVIFIYIKFEDERRIPLIFPKYLILKDGTLQVETAEPYDGFYEDVTG